jgi:hypothetical protein
MGSPLGQLEVNSKSREVTIRGAAGQPRPVIFTSGGLSTYCNSYPCGGISDLDIELTGNPFFAGLSAYGSVDHVLVHSHADGTACEVRPAQQTISDTLCIADGKGAALRMDVTFGGGFKGLGFALRNDTFYASKAGGGDGATLSVDNGGSGAGALQITATNTIIRGSATDIVTHPEASGGGSQALTVTLDHSNYATVNTSLGGTVTPANTATNQAAAPLFVNASGDDLHEAAGSPTIDAGATDPANGTTDLDANPRTIGPATDIGAYEFVPAPSCNPLATATAFGRPITIQLQCSDLFGAALAYAIVGGPTHGTLSLTAATGQALYTPEPGYSGPDAFSYDASSIHGTSAAATASITVGAPLLLPITPPLGAPVLAGIGETAKTWREGNALARITAKKKSKTKLPVGTTFSFSLNEQASVSFTFTQQLSGRRAGHKCVTQTNKNRRRRACKRAVTAGTLAFTGHAGINKLAFQGRLSSSKKLTPGSYVVTVTATNSSGGRSAAISLGFTIVR